METSPLALLARVAAAYAACRFFTYLCEQLTAAGGFPAGTGTVAAAAVLGLYSTALLLNRIRKWSPWQYAWYFAASVVIISGPGRAAFEVFTGVSGWWAETWAAAIAVTWTGAIVRLVRWRQDSVDEESDDDAED